jgi:hypothetical protein
MNMEAAEQAIVSKEDGLFPDGLVREEKRILEVLRKAKISGDRHITKDQIVQELGAYGHAVPGISRGVDGLRKKRLIIERIDSYRNGDQTMPMFRQVALTEIFLTVAGFYEALCMVNTEALTEVKAEQSGLAILPPQRLPMELIYEVYTAGFNSAILEADPYRPAMRELMKRNLLEAPP